MAQLLKNIVILNDHGFVSGGAAQVAVAGMQALRLRGLNVHFFFGTGPVDDRLKGSAIRLLDLGRFDLLANPSRWRAARDGIWDAAAAQQVVAGLQGLDPAQTIIHLHTWTKALSASVVRAVRQRGFRMVCTLHDYFAVCPNGGLYNYQERRPCSLQPMSAACITAHCDSRNYPYKLWRVARQVVQERVGHLPADVHNFITVSDFSARILQRHLPAQARFFRVTNPIDIAAAPPKSLESGDGFTFVGRLSPEKGADLLAHAALRAGVVARFVGSGDAEEQIRAIYPQAQMLGWQDRTGVIAALRASRAVVFPSLWYETQGLVVREAAALGVPAIVSDGCAARDSIVDGETGLLFKSGDVGDLTQKLRQLEDNPAQALQLGRQAYTQYWLAPHTLDRHIDELLECYNTILRD